MARRCKPKKNKSFDKFDFAAYAVKQLYLYHIKYSMLDEFTVNSRKILHRETQRCRVD